MNNPSVLIDNCVPRKFMRYMTHYAPTHVSELGWDALDDPELLRAAEGIYEVLVSGDKNLPYQNKLSNYALAVIILRAPSNTPDSFVPLVAELERNIASIKLRETRILFAPGYRPRR